MDSEKKRSDEYWMGVRDALRMVDSFSKWARRNKERAKDMDDFIHEGLIAAAKRCESCLKDDLGLTFHEDIDSPVPPGYESTPPLSEDNKSFEDVILQQADDDISIESVGRLDDEEMDDIALDGPPREFSSDFELVEPTPLGLETPALEEEDEPKEDILSEEEADGEKKPSFTWADYEEAVSPVKEEPMIDEEEFEEALELVSGLNDSPKEEPALPTDEFESISEEVVSPPIESEEIEETESPEPITEPPPPPPPPESEEDEDERRRRARRLFFGD